MRWVGNGHGTWIAKNRGGGFKVNLMLDQIRFRNSRLARILKAFRPRRFPCSPLVKAFSPFVFIREIRVSSGFPSPSPTAITTHPVPIPCKMNTGVAKRGILGLMPA